MNDVDDAQTVLVTGGAGYIGAHVCRAFSASGYLPVAYDDLSHGHSWAVRWGPLEIGDLADRPKLDSVFHRYRPRAVVHLAGLIAAGDSVIDPISFYQSNLATTLILLDTMHAHGVDRMVFSSSAGIYGEPERVPIPETHPQRPISPYGASKVMVERVLADFAIAYGLRSVALRYFNAVGAIPQDGIGEAHRHETHLVPLVLDVAAGRQPFIDIFGDDFPTPDGTCIRDYIHVVDLAAAHVLALTYLDRTAGATAFNLGSEKGASVRDVIKMAAGVTGRRIATRHKPRRPGDPAVLVADSSLARQVLGWRPVLGALDRQIASAWAWHQIYHPSTDPHLPA